MALVCDIKSNSPPPVTPMDQEPEQDPPPQAEAPPELEEKPSEPPQEDPEPAPKSPQEEEDLEDGEIEDDEEEALPATEPSKSPEKPSAGDPPKPPSDSGKSEKGRRERDRRRHEEKGHKHMTEAEKSILHLRKREKMQREKWEKYRKDHVVGGPAPSPGPASNPGDPMDDDFAKNIEKTLATILSKKEKQQQAQEENSNLNFQSPGGEEKTKSKGRKRKNKNKDNQKNKQRRLDSPKLDEIEEETLLGTSPDSRPAPNSESEASEGGSSDRSKGEEKVRKKTRRKTRRNREHRERQQKNRERERERRLEPQLKDAQGVCVFYLQGKCQKNDCPYSHEAVAPMKLELCKFYLMGCCAKGEKCSYMHSEFPCKFYHTGLQCTQAEKCKFAHGKPLSEGLKQILFKHIETAPRDILGGFPRMNREEALTMINDCQKMLEEKYNPNKKDSEEDTSIPPELEQKEKPTRNRRSRWQDPEPNKPFNFVQDQDMRFCVNGDVDMRALPPNLSIPPPNILPINTAIPPPNFEEAKHEDTEDETALQIDIKEEQPKVPDLPQVQRNLFMRIQAQQKDNLPEEEKPFELDENINWYSDDDDDDDNRLTIKDDPEDKDLNNKDEIAELDQTILSPTHIKPLEVVEKLGDLSKIDISAEVTKLLSSMSQAKSNFASSSSGVKDPRLGLTDPRNSETRDPRRSRQPSTDSQGKSDKISIYEQGSIENDLKTVENDLNLRASEGRARAEVLQLPFKTLQNYTPATEIDASISSHSLIIWKVHIVDIPRPDYTGLKLKASDAEKTGDPRLRKIFRLSVDEKDSPASPKASPKASGTVRVDPRIRKMEESKPDGSSMNYNQQLNMLQSSAFYQSLTSNQKLLLNQELASKTDQSGSHDPILNSLLSNLNIIPPGGMPPNQNLGAALNILATVSKLNPNILATQAPPNMMTQQVNPAILAQNTNLMGPNMIQQGLLGAAPGIPNMAPHDFNFDPRNGGLLGNAPPPPFVDNFQDGPGPQNFNPNFNDDFFPQDNFNNHNNNNNNRGFMRDRRRGRNFNNNNNNNRNNGNRNFRNNRNRNNRGHTPP